MCSRLILCDLDWDDARYHQDARQLLDAPFFGRVVPSLRLMATILDRTFSNSVYRYTNQASWPTLRWFCDIVTEWGIAENDWDVTLKQAAVELHQTNTQLYTVRNRKLEAVRVKLDAYTVCFSQ